MAFSPLPQTAIVSDQFVLLWPHANYSICYSAHLLFIITSSKVLCAQLNQKMKKDIFPERFPSVVEHMDTGVAVCLKSNVHCHVGMEMLAEFLSMCNNETLVFFPTSPVGQ